MENNGLSRCEAFRAKCKKDAEKNTEQRSQIAKIQSAKTKTSSKEEKTR